MLLWLWLKRHLNLLPKVYHMKTGSAPVLEIATDHQQAGVSIKTAAAPVLQILTGDQCCEC